MRSYFYSHWHPVRGVTLAGSLMLWVLRQLFRIVALFTGKRWRNPIKNFEENPAVFGASDTLYFGYKYYYRSHITAEQGSNLEEYFAREHLLPTKPLAENELRATLSAGGDLMPYQLVSPVHTQNLWDEIGDWYFNNDLVFANLETPIDTSRPPDLVPELMLSDMYFNGSAEMFEVFSGFGKYKGYDVLSFANNHMLDMGERGLRNTLDFLDEQNVRHVGAARNMLERENFPILERNGVKVAFLAYTYSMNKIRPITEKPWMTNYYRINKPGRSSDVIRRDAAKARAKGADFIVCSLHTGCAYQPYPASHTVQAFHAIFEKAGVDIILGGHPHNPQPYEVYQFNDPFTGLPKKGFAIYSLGDFVAYDIFTLCHLPLLVKLDLRVKILSDGSRMPYLANLHLKPVFNCGTGRWKNFKVRFLDLEKLAFENFDHPALTRQTRLEAHYLWRYYQRFITRQDNSVPLENLVQG